MRPKDAVRLQSASGIARKNLEAYGYARVGDLFRPHITLTRLASTRQIDTMDLPEASTFDGQFIKLALFEMGDNGTAARKIAEFNLQP